MVLEDKILAMAGFQWSSGFVPPRAAFSWPIKYTNSINGTRCNVNNPLLLIKKKRFFLLYKCCTYPINQLN